jgi:hypothetical protein
MTDDRAREAPAEWRRDGPPPPDGPEPDRRAVWTCAWWIAATVSAVVLLGVAAGWVVQTWAAAGCG